MSGSAGMDLSPVGAPLGVFDCVCVCVVFAMACLPVIQTNEEAGRQRRSLGCRRAVSWVGLRLNIIKETNETASELSQVRLRTSELFALFSTA